MITRNCLNPLTGIGMYEWMQIRKALREWNQAEEIIWALAKMSDRPGWPTRNDLIALACTCSELHGPSMIVQIVRKRLAAELTSGTVWAIWVNNINVERDDILILSALFTKGWWNDLRRAIYLIGIYLGSQKEIMKVLEIARNDPRNN